MKIFLSFLQGTPGHPIPAYGFWEFYIKNGIEEAGYNWTEADDVDWALGLVPQAQDSFNRWKTNAWNQTITAIKENRPDLFLSYLYPHQVDTAAIETIKELGIPTVNFFCDNIREFKNAPEEFKVFDLNWVPEFKAQEMYNKAGINNIHLPMPMWVEPRFRTVPQIESNKVSFIGSHDIQRQLLFEDVLKRSSDCLLEIYGAAWLENDDNKNITYHQKSTIFSKIHKQIEFLSQEGPTALYRKIKQRNFTVPYSEILEKTLKGRPSFDEYVRITQSSLITLGVNRYPSYRFPLNAPDTYSRLRDIEAPMLGACYLTEWTPGIEKMYDIGKEIEAYRSPEEIVEKVNLLTKDKNLRIRLREQGQSKALHEHGIPQSLNKIKKCIGIK